MRSLIRYGMTNMPMDFFKISEGMEEVWVTDSAQSFTVFLANERRIVINCLDNLLLASA